MTCVQPCDLPATRDGLCDEHHAAVDWLDHNEPLYAKGGVPVRQLGDAPRDLAGTPASAASQTSRMRPEDEAA